MANVKQFKQKTTGTLLDIEDTQARSDIASEITNRTNAEKEKLNMLQNYDDTEVKSEINNLKNSIYVQNGTLMIRNGGNN